MNCNEPKISVALKIKMSLKLKKIKKNKDNASSL